MGAEYFYNTIIHSSNGIKMTPTEASRKLIEEAEYYSGHGGYTGTIAEKSAGDFDDITDKLPNNIDGWADYDFEKWADQMVDEYEISKWGSYLFFEYEDHYHFFGYASS